MTVPSLPNPVYRTFFIAFSVMVFMLFLGIDSANETKAQNATGFQASEYGPDGVPVLVRNLPDWKDVVDKAKWIDSRESLIANLGSRPVLEPVDFSKALEAVFVEYPEGKLLILEYGTPQLSADADKRFKDALADPSNTSNVIYRRVGNYNAFVFDFSDATSANQLLDKIYYGKVVQWLGEDPNMAERLDRYLASTTAQLFLGTIFTISIGLGITIGIGVFAGLFFFKYRQKQRGKLRTFSDAGGMTRINIDGLSDQPTKDD